MPSVVKSLNLKDAQALTDTISKEMATLFIAISQLASPLNSTGRAVSVAEALTTSTNLRAKAADYIALASLLASTREALHLAYENSSDIRATVRAQVNQSVIALCDVIIASAPTKSLFPAGTAKELAHALSKGARLTAVDETDAITYSELKAELVRENTVLFHGVPSLAPARIEVQVPGYYAHYIQTRNDEPS